jgi:lysyl-tRNA synthetase class 2
MLTAKIGKYMNAYTCSLYLQVSLLMLNCHLAKGKLYFKVNMSLQDEIKTIRLNKIKLLKDAGHDPYPADSAREISLSHCQQNFAQLMADAKPITVAGRIRALRGQGGLSFFDLNDGTARMQCAIKKGDDFNEENFAFFQNTVDIGDFIEVTGTLFITKRGENTLQVKSWKMLTKSLRALPDKWHGIQDQDERLRCRYLDIMFNPEVQEMFILKAKFWQEVRNFLVKEEFLEVETPVLENTTGGADARPFETHHNALDIPVFLRISCGELWQKQLLVAGYPKVFEIGRIFRNEGMSPEHLQDYTQMEFYWGYADFKKGMDLVERMYRTVAQNTFGKTKFSIGKFEVDLAQPWETYDYTETIKKFTGIDINTSSLEEIEKTLIKLGVEFSRQSWSRSRAIDNLWKYCRKQIGGPGFLVGVPKEMSPLAKSDPRNPTITQRFQPIIAGSELGNGYSELNDPVDQAERFEEQAKMREAGDSEAQMFAYDFVEALEYGMPPACGFGMSERVFCFLMNKPARECQAFPLMKPIIEQGEVKEEN